MLDCNGGWCVVLVPLILRYAVMGSASEQKRSQKPLGSGIQNGRIRIAGSRPFELFGKPAT